MKSICHILLFFSILVNTYKSQCQDVYSVIDNTIIIIDPITPGHTEYIDISGPSSSYSYRGMTFVPEACAFFAIDYNNPGPEFIRIDLDGTITELGPITLPGETIYFAESLGYNPVTKKVFIAASIDGGKAQGDAYSESILEINIADATCSLVFEINQISSNLESDAFAFGPDGMLYFVDGAPPGANFLRFYSMDFSTDPPINNPTLLYSTNYLTISDMAVFDGNLNFVVDNDLRSLNLSNPNSLINIGQVYSNSDFTGNIRGIDYASLTEVSIDLGGDQQICPGESIILDATTSGATYLWSNSSTLPMISASATGNYSVEVFKDGCSGTDDVEITESSAISVDLGGDQQICPGESVILDATTSGATYLWSNGSTLPMISANTTGNYSVEVFKDGCSGTDDVNITESSAISVDLGGDQQICPGESVILDATTSGATYLWSNGSTLPMISASATGNHSVEVFKDGCSGTDDVNITESSAISVDLGGDQQICPGESVILDATTSGATYLWSNSSTLPMISASATGNYSVKVFKDGCSGTDNITITSTAINNEEIVSVLCPNESVVINNAGVQIRDQNNNIITNSEISKPGTYEVFETGGSCPIKTYVITSKGKPTISTLTPLEICNGVKTNIDVELTNTSNWFWAHSNSQDQPIITTTSSLEVFASNMCGDTIFNVVIQAVNCGLTIPNVVTPNGDGLNDELFITSNNDALSTPYDLKIYNRWGDIVFESYDYQLKWDGYRNGKKLPIGQYYYILIAENGEEYKGGITLIY